MAYLVFVDTNIFLDFYRVRGRENSLSILDHIDGNHTSFITGSQVEMEFKKNRQAVILDTYKGVKAPNFEGVGALPAFLAQSKQSSGLATSKKQVSELTKRLQTRIGRVLNKPTQHDHVYKVAQRLFKSDSPYNLDRSKSDRFRIRNLARKRFSLGYPPRKSGDISIGDAVNWEWIVECARQSGCDVVIVSRDSDYGRSFDGKPIVNDWLNQEFHERLNRKRKLILTDRLTDGLKAAGIGVTKEEAEDEEAWLEIRAADKKATRFTYAGFDQDGNLHELPDVTPSEAKEYEELLGINLVRMPKLKL